MVPGLRDRRGERCLQLLTLVGHTKAHKTPAPQGGLSFRPGRLPRGRRHVRHSDAQCQEAAAAAAAFALVEEPDAGEPRGRSRRHRLAVQQRQRRLRGVSVQRADLERDDLSGLAVGPAAGRR